tara:strand:+ start:53 stop:454 length:402 start_codon:yes stop_codon:yes gene_type:complete
MIVNGMMSMVMAEAMLQLEPMLMSAPIHQEPLSVQERAAIDGVVQIPMAMAGQTSEILSSMSQPNGGIVMATVLVTKQMVMKQMLARYKEVIQSSIEWAVEIQTAMVGRTQPRIGKQHLGVPVMLFQMTDFNG